MTGDICEPPRSIVSLSSAATVRCNRTVVGKIPLSQFAINRLNDICAPLLIAVERVSRMVIGYLEVEREGRPSSAFGVTQSRHCRGVRSMPSPTRYCAGLRRGAAVCEAYR